MPAELGSEHRADNSRLDNRSVPIKNGEWPGMGSVSHHKRYEQTFYESKNVFEFTMKG